MPTTVRLLFMFAAIMLSSVAATAAPKNADGTEQSQKGNFALPKAELLADLSPIANAPFVANAGTDASQRWARDGQDQQLAGLPTGRQQFGGVPFAVTDPAANDGLGLLVLGGADRTSFPRTAEVGIAEPRVAPHLYLLHTVSERPWGSSTPVGTVTATYTDGTHSTFTVNTAVDVADWWTPNEPRRGAIVWRWEGEEGHAGLTMTHFDLQEKPLSSLRFESSGRSAWEIVAATALETYVAMPQDQPFVITEGPDWHPYASTLRIAPGSILDFSTFLDAPAGKHGHIIVEEGQFRWERAPATRVRFYGTNLCFGANFPDKQDADALAENLARTGYNSVRLHHYDGLLVYADGNDSTTLDPAQLDKLEYLIAALKKWGIYISIDLYTFRSTQPHELPEIGKAVRSGYKTLPPILPSAMENWQRFVRNFLTHRNPYTGLTLAEDPVLVGICPINEDPLANDAHATPEIGALYDAAFARWATGNGIAPQTEADRTRAWARFYIETQTRANTLYADFLKNELGIKAPLTGTNTLDAVGLTPLRSQVDYVDNHAYWDHPGFPVQDWKLPYSYAQRSAAAAGAPVPRTMMPTRIFGKPFVSTEWNYTIPNEFRGEGALIIGAYSALQDWDGLWRFAYAHELERALEPQPAASFDSATDPLMALSERIALALFVRGDAAPAEGRVTLLVDMEAATRRITRWGVLDFPEPMNLLGLVTRVGSAWAPVATDAAVQGTITGPGADPADPDYVPMGDNFFDTLAAQGTIPTGAIDPAAGTFRSDTGELVLDTQHGSMQVVTPRTEAFTLSKPGTATGNAVRLTVPAGHATVAVIAMDDAPVAQSKRLLVLHLTDLQNSGSRYSNPRMTLMEDWGTLPHLIRAGQAELTLQTTQPLTVYPLDPAGNRLKPLPTKVKGGQLQVTLDTARLPVSMAYELVAE